MEAELLIQRDIRTDEHEEVQHEIRLFVCERLHWSVSGDLSVSLMFPQNMVENQMWLSLDCSGTHTAFATTWIERDVCCSPWFQMMPAEAAALLGPFQKKSCDESLRRPPDINLVQPVSRCRVELLLRPAVTALSQPSSWYYVELRSLVSVCVFVCVCTLMCQVQMPQTGKKAHHRLSFSRTYKLLLSWVSVMKNWIFSAQTDRKLLPLSSACKTREQAAASSLCLTWFLFYRVTTFLMFCLLIAEIFLWKLKSV